MSSIIKGIIKEEAQRLSQLETAYKQAQQITRAIKYEDGVMNIISEIQGLGQKYNIDPKSIKYAVSDVLEAKNALESAVYGLDELFKDAYQEEKWKHDDEQEGLGLREGEVVSLQARKTPLVVAGSPYDWDVYDLRTNKMVANILGGDRHESPLYEIRIRSSGMTPTTRMKPTYVLRAGRDNNPPYKAYELVDTPERYGKIEKSPGPGGTTKLRPDEDDMLRHMFKVMGGGKYYGYDLELVEEGLDQYEIIEKALGAKIMEIDDAMELGYTDWDPEDSSSIVYLGNQKNEGYSAGASGGAGLGEEVDEGIKSSIAAGILSGMGLLGSAQGQSADLSNFSTSYLQQVVSGEHPRPMVNKDDAKIELQKREQGTSTPSQPSAPKSTSGGFSNEYLKSVVDGTHPRPMVSVEKAKEILQQRGVQEHINTPGGMGQTYRKFKPKAAGINELKCWSGYTRVKGVPAGAPGSCKKKTKESSIMKGIQSEEQVDEYKEVPGQRKIEFSKENPPDLYYLYQQFIQRMLNPENTIDPKDWIEKVNNHYGLNYSWKDYQSRGHKDHTDNWQKIINKYILKKS